MANETGPHGPDGGNYFDRLKKAIAAISDREAVKALRKEMGKVMREMVASNPDKMKTIKVEDLQKELYKIYEGGRFTLTKNQAKMLTEHKAMDFVDYRDNKMTAGERKKYVNTCKAECYIDKGKEKAAEDIWETMLKEEGLDINTIGKKQKGEGPHQEDILHDPEDN